MSSDAWTVQETFGGPGRRPMKRGFSFCLDTFQISKLTGPYSSLVIYSKILATPSAVYLVGLAKSFASYTLHISAISPTTGDLLTSASIPSTITDGPSSIVCLNTNDYSMPPRVAWLEAGNIRAVALTPELKATPVSVKGAAYERVIDIGLAEKGHFVALKSDGSGRVLKLDSENAGLKVIWEFSDSVRSVSLMMWFNLMRF